jgi:hypothetical protein
MVYFMKFTQMNLNKFGLILCHPQQKNIQKFVVTHGIHQNLRNIMSMSEIGEPAHHLGIIIVGKNYHLFVKISFQINLAQQLKLLLRKAG